MTDPDPPVPPQAGYPRAKTRLPFASGAPQRSLRVAGMLLYGLLSVGLASLAVYNAVVVKLPLASGYVAAPAIGGLWFGLRLFMTVNSRK